jgi:hypothetical protein
MSTDIFNAVCVPFISRRSTQAISLGGRVAGDHRGHFSIKWRAMVSTTPPCASISPVLYRRTSRLTPFRRPGESRGPFGRHPAFGGKDSGVRQNDDVRESSSCRAALDGRAGVSRNRGEDATAPLPCAYIFLKFAGGRTATSSAIARSADLSSTDLIANRGVAARPIESASLPGIPAKGGDRRAGVPTRRSGREIRRFPRAQGRFAAADRGLSVAGPVARRYFRIMVTWFR